MSYLPKKCANPNCTPKLGFIKKGFHYVRCLNQKFRIFQCKTCKRYFTSRTFRADYRHKRMDLNKRIALSIIEGNSLRSISRQEGLTYNNTYKKFLWLKRVVNFHKKFTLMRAETIQFDELETIEHTKCKPVNVILIVNENCQILTAKVAEMPAKGRLAEFSRKKYGQRRNQRAEKMQEAFAEVKSCLVGPVVEIRSDAHPAYKKFVRQYFPDTSYLQFSARAQKMKYQERMHENNHKNKYDPLFYVNHLSGRLRDLIKRLVRRSWCTTKKLENLQLCLDLWVLENLGVIHLHPRSAVKDWDIGAFG